MIIDSREKLKQYALRKLGAPVLNIEVDDQQLEDRIDDALTLFSEFHTDGREEVYLKHKITASTMRFASAVVADFTHQETLVGATSGARATFYDKATDNLSLRFKTISGTFTNGEVVEGAESGVTATLAASNAITLGDVDNHWLPIDDSVLNIIDIFAFNGLSLSGDNWMFDIRYQTAFNSMMDLTYGDMQNYVILRQHLSLINFLFTGEKSFRYSRFQNQLHIDFDWRGNGIVDLYMVIHAHKILDPQSYSLVYSSFWLQSYTAALFKMQWGTNLKKMAGIQLPGGVILNGQIIYDEALREMDELEKELRSKYEEPPIFFIG